MVYLYAVEWNKSRVEKRYQKESRNDLVMFLTIIGVPCKVTVIPFQVPVNLINSEVTTQMLTNREVGEFAKFHAKPGRRIISIHDRNTQLNQPNYLMR